MYDAAIVRPVEVGSREGLWRGFDVRVVDGAVNGTAAIVPAARGCSAAAADRFGARVRRIALLGVVLILGYYLWS